MRDSGRTGEKALFGTVEGERAFMYGKRVSRDDRI
jgi:hypothetical protein